MCRAAEAWPPVKRVPFRAKKDTFARDRIRTVLCVEVQSTHCTRRPAQIGNFVEVGVLFLGELENLETNFVGPQR